MARICINTFLQIFQNKGFVFEPEGEYDYESSLSFAL